MLKAIATAAEATTKKKKRKKKKHLQNKVYATHETRLDQLDRLLRRDAASTLAAAF